MTTRTPSTRPRGTALAGAALAGGLLVSPLAATPADAHVRVVADADATSGGYSVLTFRVPNESDEASTTRVVVELPQDTPLSSVRTRPVPGWTVTVARAPLPSPVEVGGATLTEAPRTVTWTAQGDAAVGPDQYQDFALAVGPLPAPGEVLLPVTQTYSDGEVVRWDEPVPASGEEPEHPAPVLAVAAAAEGDDHHGAGPGTGPGTGTGAAAAVTTADGTARWLGGAGLAVAVLAAAAAGVALGTVRAGRRR
ncbi:Uncharacterized protein YcnI [Friedmanniella luteola]|uniref:Uncharacterized protein YcnI n=1 Tax=Friedmanniella luteola TaxID=546871 RepID=A0A1H1MFG0_9ACTN|nr:YcnI family protein [Friedmanniella luteola]SDR85105.1 Uncharacterized protein YcnI [Friedmanniella luteola]